MVNVWQDPKYASEFLENILKSMSEKKKFQEFIHIVPIQIEATLATYTLFSLLLLIACNICNLTIFPHAIWQ